MSLDDWLLGWVDEWSPGSLLGMEEPAAVAGVSGQVARVAVRD